MSRRRRRPIDNTLQKKCFAASKYGVRSLLGLLSVICLSVLSHFVFACLTQIQLVGKREHCAQNIFRDGKGGTGIREGSLLIVVTET